MSPIAILLATATVIGTLSIVSAQRGMRALHYVTKPLTMLLIMAVPITAAAEVDPRYFFLILAGLTLSLAGDVFLMLRSNFFIHGLVAFLAAHLFYATAFWPQAAPPAALWAVGGLCAGLGALVYRRLRGNIPAEMKVPVLVYTTAILAMVALASTRALSLAATPAVLAAAGAWLFATSDTALASDRFGPGIAHRHLLVLSTYYAAQALIALSATLT
ncbi:MAG: lysoplasmalogenase [Deltaproteobacteria bacterium]